MRIVVQYLYTNIFNQGGYLLKFRVYNKKDNNIYYNIKIIQKDNNIKIKIIDTSQTLNSDDFMLMTSSGLYDINGKEIYEGDIMYMNIYGSLKLGEVVFKKGNFILKYKDFESLLSFIKERKILGNIYEKK